MPISTYPDPINAVDAIGKVITALDAVNTVYRAVRDQTTSGPSRKTSSTHTDNPYPRNGSDSAETHAYYLNGTYTARSNFPIGGPLYTSINPRDIYPWMHTVGAAQNSVLEAKYNGNMIYAIQKDNHITSNSSFDPIYDPETLKQISAGNFGVGIYPIEEIVPGVDSPFAKWNLQYRQSNVFQFQGSVTPINPEGDPEKHYIMTQGLENSDKRNANVTLSATNEAMASPETPTSPLHPFLRSYSERSHDAIVTMYNRTRLPIADIEHRKAFRYIFITRPECYLLSTDGDLSVQAAQDEDTATCWMRMPHVLRALSPVYVCPAPGNPKYANWNYLLCNRVLGMSTAGQTLSVLDSITKGVRGATVTPGKIMTSNLGGTLELSFRDTKYMDVYEMIRMWMWYIHKRRTGQFFPSFNGYQKTNDGFATGIARQHMHPYDRALEYCASIYDIITNETGTKILYWCKYYGVYPVSCQNGMLSSDNATAITGDARISASFQYQYKQENVYKNLIEFNYNAGIFDNMGHMYSDVQAHLQNAVPFLYRENYSGGGDTTSNVLRNYIGASSMMTGSPFIISESSSQHDPWKWSNDDIVQNNLCFLPAQVVDTKLASKMTLGITNEMSVRL